MGTVDVDQIRIDGTPVRDVDTTLSEQQKNGLLLEALPGATAETYADLRVVRFLDQVILKAQVTHLGYPWPEFKKRIQVPRRWVEVERHARADGLVPRFVGIYHYEDVTIFVDFDPTTYVKRKANNSAAHVATNDLFQAQTLGQFSREDRNGNRLTSVRADEFEKYLRVGYESKDRRLDVIRQFNAKFFDGSPRDWRPTVEEMHAAVWPDRFQGEWPGFYLEFRLDSFVRSQKLSELIEFQKDKAKGKFDYDLVFRTGVEIEHYGDLKASNITTRESPGNDSKDFNRCLDEYGRFWYVIYEHETVHERDNANLATIEWNDWRRSVGFDNGKPYDELSYRKRFKQSVRFVGMKVLEINRANLDVALGDMAQGKQQSGAARAMKVKIKKKDIDNFLIYSESIG